MVAARVVISVLFAIAVLVIGSPLLAAGTGVVMPAFAALGIREVLHQLDESRTGLAVLAVAVAVLHVYAAFAAFIVARSGRRRPDTPRRA